jgi:hypothetical protein
LGLYDYRTRGQRIKDETGGTEVKRKNLTFGSLRDRRLEDMRSPKRQKLRIRDPEN